MRPTMRCPAIGRGDQEGRFFHGDHDGCCFLPLCVFCGDHLLVACLRSADIDPAKHSPGILKLLVGQLRRAGRRPPWHWPRQTSQSRDRMRRVIARLAHGPRGANPRFPPGGRRPRALRGSLLRPRREGEPHQGTAAPTLRRSHRVPRMVAQPVPPAPRSTPSAGATSRAPGWSARKAPPSLLKIGAVIVRNTRRVRCHLSSACPDQDLFHLIAARREPGWRPTLGPARSGQRRKHGRKPRRAPGPRKIHPEPPDSVIHEAKHTPEKHQNPKPQRNNTKINKTETLHEIAGLVTSKEYANSKEICVE